MNGDPSVRGEDSADGLREPELRDAAAALRAGRADTAEQILRPYLDAHPANVNALMMLAEVAMQFDCGEDAEDLLARCVRLAPGFAAARFRYAALLLRHNKPDRAILQVDHLLQGDPRNPACLSLKADALSRIGDCDGALACDRVLLIERPDHPAHWSNHANRLRVAGRHDESIAAYRQALERSPGYAEAYWGLGNLKTFRYQPSDVEAMTVQLRRPDLMPRDRVLLHFALGKAFEDSGLYQDSFSHYREANGLQRMAVKYDADRMTEFVGRTKAVFTEEFLARRAGVGCESPEPIFVVGLPRSGSTLVEQILASHSEIEATLELPNIGALSGRMDGPYPEILRDFDPSMFEALGEDYLADTRPLRLLGRRCFIDKMPDNFRHAGLIHLILPNAKIVDVRRNPLACCFSCFKQDFEAAYPFTYDLAELGRYYADYVDLMAHFDRVLPGRVHHVSYEALVGDPEREIRRLLAYLGLAFEQAGLSFHENKRPIRTASSQQVRLPIFRDALDQWQNYEPWLGPLKAALGAAAGGPVSGFTSLAPNR